jgi:hypothetical protein
VAASQSARFYIFNGGFHGDVAIKPIA